MLGLGARQTVGIELPQPIPVSAVSSVGWIATLANPSSFAGPISFPASRGGFDSNGDPTTHNESLKVTSRIFNAWNGETDYSQATLTADQAALSDFVYKTDTISSLSLSGLADSPKPVCQWLTVDRCLVDDTITVEIFARHRDGIACVEVRATDGSTTVSAKSSTPVVSPRTTDLGAVVCHRITLDISTLANPADITVNAKAWPRIGGAASVADSADLTTSNADRRLFSPRIFRRDTALAAAPIYVAVVDSVAGGGSTTPYVGPDKAAAEASPASSFQAAFNRANAVLSDMGGLRVLLMGKAIPSGNAPVTFPTTAPTHEVIIEPATGVSKAAAIVEWGAATAGFRVPFVRFRGVTINRVGTAGNFTGSAGYHTVYDDVIFNNQGRNAALSSTASTGTYWDGAIITGAMASMLAASNHEQRMVRGVDLTPQTPGAISNVELFNTHGSVLETVNSSNAIVRNQSGRTQSATFYKKITGSVPIQMNTGGDVVGAWFEQNVFEFNSATSAVSLAISSDGQSINTDHVGIVHNTFAGFFNWGRVNFFYNETDNVLRTHTRHRDWGNLYVSLNTKHDFFAGISGKAGDNTARTGGWSYDYGAGAGYNFSRYQDAGGGNWGKRYAGEGSVVGTATTGAGNDPLFTNYQAANDNGSGGANAGSGNGTYTLQAGSPCLNAVPIKPWTPPHDFAGNPRSGNVAFGAYAGSA